MENMFLCLKILPFEKKEERDGKENRFKYVK
jgi:hypothetical protein